MQPHMFPWNSPIGNGDRIVDESFGQPPTGQSGAPLIVCIEMEVMDDCIVT
jgi:hypothetical protein